MAETTVFTRMAIPTTAPANAAVAATMVVAVVWLTQSKGEGGHTCPR